MKTRILSDFNIIKMNKNSLTLEEKGSNDKVYITRTLFNNLDNVKEIRICDPLGNGSKWIEGCYWSRF